MIKEIMAHFKDEGLEITFRMYSGYFDDAILETIESLGGKYVIYFFFITNTEKSSEEVVEFLEEIMV